MLAGKYEVIEQIGTGGVGYVLAARHHGFDAEVALKFLYPELSAIPECLSYFVREARTAFRIQSPHVVRLLDVGSLEDGTPFIAMERLHGTDLRRLLARGGPMRERDVIAYGKQICDGLAVAHELGVVHLDIKPENIFVIGEDAAAHSGAGSIKLLDFGISRYTLEARAGQHGVQVTGTPGYMSPEQLAAAEDLDARSDIWSLGCVLHEMVTGHCPLEPRQSGEVARSPRASTGLEAIIERCMTPDRAQRYATVQALGAALTALTDPPPRAARAVGAYRTTDARAVINAEFAEIAGERRPGLRSRSWTLWTLTVLGGLAIAAWLVQHPELHAVDTAETQVRRVLSVVRPARTQPQLSEADVALATQDDVAPGTDSHETSTVALPVGVEPTRMIVTIPAVNKAIRPRSASRPARRRDAEPDVGF